MPKSPHLISFYLKQKLEQNISNYPKIAWHFVIKNNNDNFYPGINSTVTRATKSLLLQKQKFIWHIFQKKKKKRTAVSFKLPPPNSLGSNHYTNHFLSANKANEKTSDTHTISSDTFITHPYKKQHQYSYTYTQTLHSTWGSHCCNFKHFTATTQNLFITL